MKLTALSASAVSFALALVLARLADNIYFLSLGSFSLPLSLLLYDQSQDHPLHPKQTKPIQFINLSSQDFNANTDDLTPRSGEHSASFYSGGTGSGTD